MPLIKFKRALSNIKKAWWVILIMVGYSVFASIFTGTMCMLASTTGLPCPGCGGSRAFVSLINGDMAQSLRFHPALVPALVFAIIYLVAWLSYEAMPRVMERVLLVFVVLIMSLFVVRLILLYPHREPLVYNHNAILPRLYYLAFGR